MECVCPSPSLTSFTAPLHWLPICTFLPAFLARPLTSKSSMLQAGFRKRPMSLPGYPRERLVRPPKPCVARRFFSLSSIVGSDDTYHQGCGTVKSTEQRSRLRVSRIPAGVSMELDPKSEPPSSSPSLPIARLQDMLPFVWEEAVGPDQ